MLASLTGPHLNKGGRSSALRRQIKILEENPTVDYVLWGHEDAPGVPHAVIYMDVLEVGRFLFHRQGLFYRGNDADDLAFLIITLEQIVLRKKIPKATLHAQLRREFGKDLFDEVLGSIKSKKYHRKLDGKVYAVNDIPCLMRAAGDKVPELLPQLKAAGRFPEHLCKESK